MCDAVSGGGGTWALGAPGLSWAPHCPTLTWCVPDSGPALAWCPHSVTSQPSSLDHNINTTLPIQYTIPLEIFAQHIHPNSFDKDVF